MARVKIPGVYMLRNKLNGKVYIGQSKDLRLRWSRYQWAVKSNSDYVETSRPITLAIKDAGIDNFEFIILESGDTYKDSTARLLKEAEYIIKYQADDPKYGYNRSKGFESGPKIKPRDQSVKERLKRSKAVIEYDTKTGYMMLYASAKSWGKHRGHGKDVASHAVVRGMHMDGRYYIIYADKNRRHNQRDTIYRRMVEDAVPYAMSETKFQEYSDIIDFIDDHW